MKKLIFILFVFYSVLVSGQELLFPELETEDTLQLEAERDFMYRKLLSGSVPAGELMMPFQLPEVNFNAGLTERWTFDSSELFGNQYQLNEYFPATFGWAPSPFLRSGSVFSSAAYKLNDRFSVGGYSFGARSMFTAPLPNQGLNSFDVRGSTMFMQYKVSKNIKIETRINVTQGPGPGF